MAQLLYDSGLRRMEDARPRARDVDFEDHTFTIRDGRGEKDRIVPMPEAVTPKRRHRIEWVCLFHTLRQQIRASLAPDLMGTRACSIALKGEDRAWPPG